MSMVSGTYPRLVPYRGRFLDSSSGACINLCNLMYLLYLSKGSSCFCRETLRVTSRNLHHGTSHEKRAKHCEDVYESNERKTEFTAKLQKKKKRRKELGKKVRKAGCIKVQGYWFTAGDVQLLQGGKTSGRGQGYSQEGEGGLLCDARE